jgi:hypothetical protein
LLLRMTCICHHTYKKEIDENEFHRGIALLF